MFTIRFSSINNNVDNLEASVEGVVAFIDKLNPLKQVVVDEPLAIEDERKKKKIYDAFLRKPHLSDLFIRPDASDGEDERLSVDLSIALFVAKALYQVKSLKLLYLSRVDFDNEVAGALSNALRHNRTLEEFWLREINTNTIGDACDMVVQAVAYSLRYRSSLKKFSIRLVPLSETTYTALAEALQRAHSSLERFVIATRDDLPAQVGANILNAIASNKTLREVELDCIASDTEDVVGTALFCLLSSNTTLQKLSLYGPYAYLNVMPGPDADDGIDVTSFAPSLVSNQSLKEFALHAWGIGDGGIRSVCEAVMENGNILQLGLSKNNFGMEGLSAIKGLLSRETALTHIGLGYNRINDENIFFICEPLEANNSLEALSINDNDIGNRGIRTIIDTVKRNSTITKVMLGDHVDTALENELRYYLELNKGARKLLSASPPLPLSLWPKAFKKADNCRQTSGGRTSAPDVLYYLVKAKADLFSGIPPKSQKPKRKRRRKNW